MAFDSADQIGPTNALDPDGPNLLVISDLHLGEDLKPFSAEGENPVAWLRHVVKLERELEAFLAHHTTHRQDGRPWRLIVNGDMVDFLSVCLFPADGDGSSDDERQFGVGTDAVAAVRKIESVARRHAAIFRRLSGWIAAGHELHVVLGNHDVEFHWEPVQQAFRALLVAGVEGAPAGSEERLGAAVQFHPWFYFQKGLCYIEHGHQYDEYCSFDYVLAPVQPAELGSEQKDSILLSIAHAGQRYVCNLFPMFDPHGQEYWHWTEYFRVAFRIGARGVTRLAYMYLLMLSRLFGVWRSLRREVVDHVRKRLHLERLRAMATRLRMPEADLIALDGLRRPSVLRSLWRLLNTFFLDRFAVAVLCASLVAAALLWVPGGLAKGAASAAVLAVFWLTDRQLARLRMLDSEIQMRTVPARIRKIVDTPLVVFGHSHDPGAHELPDGGWYFNTGTWVPAERPGPEHAFTHLCIRRDAAGVLAELRQWRNGVAAPYAEAKRVLAAALAAPVAPRIIKAA